jgi:hypothetical protein
MLQDLTLQTFEICLNHKFRLEHEKGDLEVELIECRKISSSGLPPGQREPFSLMFSGPRQPVLPQGIYRFSCEQLGSFEIFIVPVGSGSSGTQYQAIFS